MYTVIQISVLIWIVILQITILSIADANCSKNTNTTESSFINQIDPPILYFGTQLEHNHNGNKRLVTTEEMKSDSEETLGNYHRHRHTSPNPVTEIEIPNPILEVDIPLKTTGAYSIMQFRRRKRRKSFWHLH
jgi:hypothetical protein